MNKEQREILKRLVDEKARQRAESGYMNCDPGWLTSEAVKMDQDGAREIASALRNFRDMVVNPLLGEGWSLDRIEQAAFTNFTSDSRVK